MLAPPSDPAPRPAPCWDVLQRPLRRGRIATAALGYAALMMRKRGRVFYAQYVRILSDFPQCRDVVA